MTSGLPAIARGLAHGTPLLLGGADPRREGAVMGDLEEKVLCTLICWT
jgi:gamma-glutamyltranspeptidase / glutathione hydrolase